MCCWLDPSLLVRSHLLDLAPVGVEEGIDVIVAMRVGALLVETPKSSDLTLFEVIEKLFLHHVMGVHGEGKELGRKLGKAV